MNDPHAKRGNSVPPLLRGLHKQVSEQGGLLLEVSRKQVICDDSLLYYTSPGVAAARHAPSSPSAELSSNPKQQEEPSKPA